MRVVTVPHLPSAETARKRNAGAIQDDQTCLGEFAKIRNQKLKNEHCFPFRTPHLLNCVNCTNNGLVPPPTPRILQPSMHACVGNRNAVSDPIICSTDNR